MLRKLYALVSGSCSPDNPDSPQHQEVLLPGSLYGMIIKERLDEILNQIRANIAIDVRNNAIIDFNDSKLFPKFTSENSLYSGLQNDISRRSCLRSTLTLEPDFPTFLQRET